MDLSLVPFPSKGINAYSLPSQQPLLDILRQGLRVIRLVSATYCFPAKDKNGQC